MATKKFHYQAGYSTTCMVDYDTDNYEKTDSVEDVNCRECVETLFKVLLPKMRRSVVLQLVAPKVS